MSQNTKFIAKCDVTQDFRYGEVNSIQHYMIKFSRDLLQVAGADPGFYVRGRTSLRGVWGPPRSPSGPGQRPVGGPGRSPRKLMGIIKFRTSFLNRN